MNALDLKTIVRFARKHVRETDGWRLLNLWLWARWYRDAGGVFACSLGGEMVGLGFARPVWQADFSIDRYAWDDEGDTIFIDMVVCLAPGAMGHLWEQMIDRMGEERKYVAARRAKHGNRLDVLSFEKTDRRFRGIYA